MSRQKLIRFAQLDTLSNVLQEKDRCNFSSKYSWSNLFGNTNPICLELGCGRGEYTNQLAVIHSNINYIGVDLKGERVWKGATDGATLKNVFFIRSQIQFINSFFVDQKISEIWLTFCDPQPDKPKKRLTSKIFLDQYLNILDSNGMIHLKTDSDLLYNSTIEVLEGLKNEGYKVNIIAKTKDLYNSSLYQNELKIKTKYEEIFVNKGMTIKYLKFNLQLPNHRVDLEEFSN
jgi:tRNA (guanine-N7-)-methyltransferase